MSILDCFSLYISVILFWCLIDLHSVSGLGAEPYYSNFYSDQQQQQLEYKIKAAIDRLDPGPQYVPDWPKADVKFGQVSGVAIDNSGNVVVFHRASNVWDGSTFTDRNVYRAIGDPPISEPTILVFNETGDLIDQWGENMFYMPHGITVDSEGNTWVTDVALHQVFKFSPNQKKKPELVLGEKFVPGADERHYCKPSAVAVTAEGDFFVADGYCNSRIIKYAADGTKILQWGRRAGEGAYALRVPHALALCGAERALCVADRERGRAACFERGAGAFLAHYRSWLLGDQLYGVACSDAADGRLYVVNGAGAGGRARGFVLQYPAGRVVAAFAPPAGLRAPHALAVSRAGDVYVAQLDPPRVLKFRPPAPAPAAPAPPAPAPPAPAPPAPAPPARAALAGAAWAAAGAGAALLGLLALLAARARGAGGAAGAAQARRRWEYGGSQFQLRRLLERRRFTRVHSDDSEDEPAPMLPPAREPPQALA